MATMNAMKGAGIPAPKPAALNPVPQAGDFGGLVDKRIGGVFDRGMNLLRPGMEQAQSGLRSRLANQGIGIGSRAWADATNRLDQQHAGQRENLALSAIGAGFGEHSRLSDLALRGRGQVFGERQAQFDMDMRQRQQALNERQLERSQAWNELMSVLKGTPINNPQFQDRAQYSTQAPDFMGMTQRNYQTQAQAAAQNSPWNFLGTLAGGWAGGGFQMPSWG